VAAADKGRPGQIGQPLHPRQGGGIGPDVLEEAELPAGSQHPVELGERKGLVGYRAQHQRDDGGVHAPVRRGERRGGAVDHADGDGRLVGGGLGEGTQVRFGLERK